MTHWRPTAKTNVRGKGRHDIIFSNCDNELLLWIDGAVVSFDVPTTYQDLENARPDDADLAPVGVASTNARVQLSHLRVLRDIYYGAVRGEGMPTENGDVQYAPDHAMPDESKLSHPGQKYVDFPLGADQFFVLGDNSARSKDGRLWGADNYWVPRELLIGKAMVLSWPCCSYNIPYLNAPFPFFPNVDRMGLIR
jgi:signal peptidase I